MGRLEYRLEDRFHAAANAAHLRSLHAAGDLNGLLEYALLLADAEATSRSKIHRLIGEAMARPPLVEQRHLEMAESLLRPEPGMGEK